MEILKVTDLDVHYGGIHALKQVNFSIRAGEIVTLIGANGAGKSTTLRAISGLVPKSGGTIEFDGSDITKLPAHKIAALKLTHVPEGRRVFPQLSVEVNLELGLTCAATNPRLQKTCRKSMSCSHACGSVENSWQEASAAANSRCLPWGGV